MIRIEDMAFGYRRAPLYRDFSLLLSEPGVYGLFGRNGSGKSTLLLLLAGLLFPKGGRIEVVGHSPAKRHPDFLAQVYIVPEEFHLPNLRPAQLAASQSRFYPNFSAAAFEDYLRIFEVPAQSSFEQMSLGQKKKAAIAFALATLTPVLLLDEPTNGLDIISRDQFRAIMARPEQRQRIVLISTHQAHDLERIMSHILFIDGASLALSATMADLGRALRMRGTARAPAWRAPRRDSCNPVGCQSGWLRRVAVTPRGAAGVCRAPALSTRALRRPACRGSARCPRSGRNRAACPGSCGGPAGPAAWACWYRVGCVGASWRAPSLKAGGRAGARPPWLVSCGRRSSSGRWNSFRRSGWKIRKRR